MTLQFKIMRYSINCTYVKITSGSEKTGTQLSHMTFAQDGVPHVEQGLLPFRNTGDHSQFLVGFVLLCLQFSMLCLLCLVIFFFGNGVVSLFSIYGFGCPSGIFRHSFAIGFKTKKQKKLLFSPALSQKPVVQWLSLVGVPIRVVLIYSFWGPL